MLKAAICDDEPVFLEDFREKLNSCAAKFHIDVDLISYDNGRSLTADLSEYDAVFLDIDMPDISGFDIAEQIGGACDTLIIFVTSHDELVFSSLKFRPFRFIRKTYLESELPEALLSIKEEIARRRSESKFAIKTKTGESFVNLRSVIYIEIYGHWLRVHVKDGKPLECYGALTSLEKQLDEYDFVRTHRSFLVNSRYIYSIERNQVTLDDGTIIPLSRYKAENVKNKFKELFRSTL